MSLNRNKVIVAMSGGVDSSVAACLLVDQGYDVTGLFMRVGQHGGATDRAESVRAAGFSPRGPSDSVTSGAAAVPSPSAANERFTKHTGAAATAVRPGSPRMASVPGRPSCCSSTDAADARFVAGQLGIPFYVLNFQSEFDGIIDYFVDEYVRGRTPNPCILCNDRLKFGKLLEYADALDATWIATGHYARIAVRNGRSVLMRGRDAQKDQSYVLFSLNHSVLDRVMFPVGELTKSDVRHIAARYGLPNCDKPESVDICFAPDRRYARIVRQRRPDAFMEGDVLDPQGRVIGRHPGIAQFTIGQRRGLGIAAGKPVYVTRLNADANTVTLGDSDDLMAPALIADRANFLADVPDGLFRADVKIRYLHQPTPTTVERLDSGKVRVVFDQPQRAITPGQAVVFYDGDVLLGGAWINHAEPQP